MKKLLTILTLLFFTRGFSQLATARNQSLIINAEKTNSVVSLAKSYSYGVITLTLTGSGAGYAAGDVMQGVQTVTLTGVGGHYVEFLDCCAISSNSVANGTATFNFFNQLPTGTLNDNATANITFTANSLNGTIPLLAAIASTLTASSIMYNPLNQNQLERTFLISQDVMYLLPISVSFTNLGTLYVRITYRKIN